MVHGWIENREAIVRLTLIGTDGGIKEVDAIVDTGFTASLTLPLHVIAELDLQWYGGGRAILADGRECLYPVYEVDVMWDGKMRRVTVAGIGTKSLVGMTFLEGHELKISVREKGIVTIQRE